MEHIGIMNLNCKNFGFQVGGQCPCKANVTGRACDQCTEGSYNLQALDTDGCTPCECNRQGTVGGNQACDQVTGDCFCKDNVRGTWHGGPEAGSNSTCTDRCFACAPLYRAGQAVCSHALQGNSAMTVCGFYNLNEDNPYGLFSCFTGKQCNDCEFGFYNLNEDNLYSLLSFFTGKQCNDCEYGFYNLNEDNPYGCAPCSCSPVGSLSLSCNPLTGQCLCKDNVQGHKCDQCMDGFYNFSMGCLPCNCNVTGTEAGTTCDR